MRRLALLAVVLAVAACGDKKKQKRTGDAAPVEVITQAIDAPSAEAGNVDELEPNDGTDTATPLAPGGTARGKIDPEGDADYYRLEIAEAGALALTLPAVEADLSLEVLDPAGQSVAKSDRAAKRGEEGVPNLGVTPGRYTVIVRGKKSPPPPKPKKGKKGTPAPPPPAPAGPVAYELTATVAAPAAATEREPDDDRGTANGLIVGETISGYAGWTGDADVYKLSIEALGAKNIVELEVSAVDGVAFTLEVADALGKPLVTRKGAKSAALLVPGLSLTVPAGAPPFAYVTVRADKSNPVAAYQLRGAEQPAPDDVDVEPNDTVEQAMPMPPDRTELPARWSVGDVDCFAIPPSDAARVVQVTVETQDDADFGVELLVDGKVIAKADTPGKRGTEVVSAPVPAGVTAVARVKASEASAPAAYAVKVGEAPPAR